MTGMTILGLSTGRRVSSLMILNTSATGSPFASAFVQLVRLSATAFRKALSASMLDRSTSTEDISYQSG